MGASVHCRHPRSRLHVLSLCQLAQRRARGVRIKGFSHGTDCDSEIQPSSFRPSHMPMPSAMQAGTSSLHRCPAALPLQCSGWQPPWHCHALSQIWGLRAGAQLASAPEDSLSVTHLLDNFCMPVLDSLNAGISVVHQVNSKTVCDATVGSLKVMLVNDMEPTCNNYSVQKRC